MREYDQCGYYSDLIRVPNGHFKVSGIKSWEGNKIRGETVAAQFERIMGHLNRALENAGLRLTDITFVSVFLADLALYEELNSAYSRSFPHKPCRAVIGGQLRNGALVEVVAEGWSDA